MLDRFASYGHAIGRDGSRNPVLEAKRFWKLSWIKPCLHIDTGIFLREGLEGDRRNAKNISAT